MNKRHLIKLCQSGDREAFGILYQTYLTPMRDTVRYYVNNSDAVWDILHDGFIIAFASIGSLKDAEKIEAWLTSIMKNLALQYLKEESNHVYVPLSDVSIANDNDVDNQRNSELTWDELNRIIDKLPEGYSKVFRLAVLDGLSHKEIGALLGIAPHSSSSQLSHAKAMMRRMIKEYRMEMGIFSIMAIILLLWHGIFRHKENTMPTPTVSKNTDKSTTIIVDSITDAKTRTDSIIQRSKTIYKTDATRTPELTADATLPADSIPVVKNDNVTNNATKSIPNIIDHTEHIAYEGLPRTQLTKNHDLSLSLAYSGTLGQNDDNRYRIPNPELPDVEGPTGEIEVTEKTRHHMPVVIGLSLSKSLNPRWSIETGIRYTLLRSDFLSESKLASKETVQRIHYIGIPLKFNYRILTYNGFSLYGQGGVAFDIPIYGTQSIWEYSPKPGTTTNDLRHIHAPLQWSVDGGLGIQYHFTPSLSIYAEPSLRYYFNSGNGIKTIRQEKPFEFTLPIGLRLTW
ncbi:MAG: sigma-70 family RNA polymerase sigma factor [Muribaculaceae bacterium]|nr:sigma-70 family RNA polymerase sigma factor [Muribaculaceae bacterium]